MAEPSKTAVGFWPYRARGATHGFYTDREIYVPPEAIDEAWSPEERAIVVTYLTAGEVRTRWRGYSNCAICHVRNGSTDLTDGTWVWPEGYGHYVEKHGVKPPSEFIEHVLLKLGGK